MKTVRYSRPTFHKSAHKILIYGLILQIKNSTESLKCDCHIEAESIHHLVIQNNDTSISWLIVPALREMNRNYYINW